MGKFCRHPLRYDPQTHRLRSDDSCPYSGARGYRVRRGNTWYIADEDGDLVDGIYGRDIFYFPFGYVTLQRSSGYWDIYHCSGRKVECYSEEAPLMFRNGCFLIKQGRYWYAVDADGDKMDGVYGDSVILLNDGRWKCIRGSYVTYID